MFHNKPVIEIIFKKMSCMINSCFFSSHFFFVLTIMLKKLLELQNKTRSRVYVKWNGVGKDRLILFTDLKKKNYENNSMTNAQKIIQLVGVKV